MTRSEQGFTLVELMISLAIFGMISAAGVALLSFSATSQAAATERLDDSAAMRRASALLASDLAQATARLTRDASGTMQPALKGGTGREGEVLLALSRRGWENHDGIQRPSVQKVEYALAAGRLERRAYTHLDGGKPSVSITLLDSVKGLRVRYRDAQGEWRDRWDPQQPWLLPRALEVTATIAGFGEVRQLFLTGTAA